MSTFLPCLMTSGCFLQHNHPMWLKKNPRFELCGSASVSVYLWWTRWSRTHLITGSWPDAVCKNSRANLRKGFARYVRCVYSLRLMESFRGKFLIKASVDSPVGANCCSESDRNSHNSLNNIGWRHVWRIKQTPNGKNVQIDENNYISPFEDDFIFPCQFIFLDFDFCFTLDGTCLKYIMIMVNDPCWIWLNMKVKANRQSSWW